ncbi:hypothetical protein C0U44_32480, partial [Klebsiella pneumoniae]
PEIVQGRYPVGSRLPPERQYCRNLIGVSRTIVREALPRSCRGATRSGRVCRRNASIAET